MRMSWPRPGVRGRRADYELIFEKDRRWSFRLRLWCLRQRGQPIDQVLHGRNVRPLIVPCTCHFNHLFCSLVLPPSGVPPWLCNKSSDPGMQNLRRNKDEAHRVARELLDSKRQELKAGAPRRDLTSLLGLSPTVASIHVVVETLPPPVKANDSPREDWRLTDDEVICQVR